MGWFSSEKDDVERLLGSSARALTEQSEIASWQPNLNYKAFNYFLQRAGDQAEFRSIADELGVSVQEITGIEEAIWELPDGVVLGGWLGNSVPVGEGLQATGMVGRSMVRLKWYNDSISAVVSPSYE